MWAWKSGGSKVLCKCTLWTWVAQRSLDYVFRAGQHAMLSTPPIQALFKNKETILKLNTNTILTSNQLAFHPFSNIDSWKSADLSSTFSLVLFGFLLSWMEVTTIVFNLFVQQLWYMRPVNISINRFVAYALQNLTFAWVLLYQTLKLFILWTAVMQRIKADTTLILRAELHVFFYFSLVQWRYLSWYSLDVPFSPLFQGPPGRPGFPVTVFCHFGWI